MFAWRTIWVSKNRSKTIIETTKRGIKADVVNIQDFFFYREFNLDKVKKAHLANVKKDL